MLLDGNLVHKKKIPAIGVSLCGLFHEMPQDTRGKNRYTNVSCFFLVAFDSAPNTGYIVISANGGLNQQRVAVSHFMLIVFKS